MNLLMGVRCGRVERDEGDFGMGAFATLGPAVLPPAITVMPGPAAAG